MSAVNARRERHAMPQDIRAALAAESLWEAYLRRPSYQQNDYVGWITRAKRPATRDKRLTQMLDELRTGGVYMKMKHQPSAEATAPVGRNAAPTG